MDETNILGNETLARIAGGAYPGGDLWNRAVISTYLPQLEQLMRGATHSEDRAIIRRYFSAIMSTYGGYQGGQGCFNK